METMKLATSRFLAIPVCLVNLAAPLLAAANEPTATQLLEQHFASPPLEAKAGSFWFWFSGHVSKEGITADLEDMKQRGMSGGAIFSKSFPSKKQDQGPVIMLSEQWLECMTHAAKEAHRLGLSIGFHNCDGHAESGGPWITPEHAMKTLVWSRQVISAGNSPVKLTKPPVYHGFYRDVAVVAVPQARPVPAMFQKLKKISATVKADAGLLADGNPRTKLYLKSEDGKPLSLDLVFSAPLTAERLLLSFPPERMNDSPSKRYSTGGKLGVEVQISEDGKSWKALKSQSFNCSVFGQTPLNMDFKKSSSAFWRVAITPSQGMKDFELAELTLLNAGEFAVWEPRIPWLEAKSSSAKWKSSMFDTLAGQVPDSEVIPVDSVLDLTDRMTADGTLDWTPPNDRSWVVLRFGYTLTGEENHPASLEGQGLESDKLSAEATDIHFDHFARKVLEAAGPEVCGKGLDYVAIDSWECRFQNWTKGFEQEFESRRGYSLVKWLPVIAGEVVESASASEKILSDFRRTISDLVVQNYIERFEKRCGDYGVDLHVEGLYSWPNHLTVDTLAQYGRSDVPMCEFWYDSGLKSRADRVTSQTTQESASSAHLYGKRVVEAEAFTTVNHLDYRQTPFDLKDIGDKAFCEGVNRYILHCYSHSPRITNPFFPIKAGLKFGRANALWSNAHGWFDYVARIQALLQSGTFKADILYFAGDDVPLNEGRTEVTDLPPGFRSDTLNSEILARLIVTESKSLRVPGGGEYAVLVLPEHGRISKDSQTQIDRLIASGATVVDPAGKRATTFASLKEALARRSLAPDFDYVESNKPSQTLQFIHRTAGDADVYFIANGDGPVDAALTFRVQGKKAELWDPFDGSRKLLHQAEATADGRTFLPLRFAERASRVVVFVPEAEAVDSYCSVYDQIGGFQKLPEMVVDSEWRVELPETGKTFPCGALKSLHEFEDPDLRYHGGAVIYRNSFHLDNKPEGRVWLDLGQVWHLADVKVNGQSFPQVWMKPYRLDVGPVLKAGENSLEIRVMPTLANRLNAEISGRSNLLGLQPEGSVLKMFYSTDELEPAGLAGPVKLMFE